MENGSATYISSPYTGVLYKSNLLFVDPSVAFRTRFSEFERVYTLDTVPEHRRREISDLKPGEWIRYHEM